MTKTIVIADDDAGIAEAYRILLSPVRDLSINFLSNAEELINMLHVLNYDAVILDNNFGENRLKGIESLRIIREFDKKTPIYLISFEVSRESAINAGATDYADKGDFAETSGLIIRKIIPYLNSLQPTY